MAVEKLLNIQGVETIFKVVKSKLNMTKDELMAEIKKNSEIINQRIQDLEDHLNDDYYTKIEIDGMLPYEISKDEIDESYDEVNN